MAASLIALPEELISAIASCASIPALANLALASKLLNRIATAHLYHSIAFNDCDAEVNYKRLRLLVIHLLQHPEYAAYIEHLQIGDQWPPCTPIQQTPLRSRDPVLWENINSIAGLFLDRGDRWDEAEALLIVLLRLACKLRTLNSSLPAESRQHWAMFIGLAQHLLPNLREIAIVEDAKHERNRQFSHSVFFDLPELESVFVYSFEALEGDRDLHFRQLEMNNLIYMNHVMTSIRSRLDETSSRYCPDITIPHLEVSDAYLDSFSLVDLIYAFPALRTFAFDFRKSAIPEHPRFFNALISVLSTRAETLTALSIGGHPDDCHETATPIDFSSLGNLNHLRISISVFLGSKSGAQSLTDDRMRERFPASLQKLVLLVYKSEEHHILPPLQHYIDAEPPIIPNLKELEVCCHAPEAMHGWLQGAAERHGIHLRIFRKLKTSQEDLSIIPFVNTVKGTKQEISQVKITITPPVSNLLLEELMPLEEYMPDTEIVVPIFEEASMHAA